MQNNRSVTRVAPFRQLTREVYDCAAGLPSDAVTALCFRHDGALYVGTEKGLALLSNGRLTRICPGEISEPVASVCTDGDAALIACGNRLLRLRDESAETARSYSVPVKAVAKGEAWTWVLTENALYRYDENGTETHCMGLRGTGSCLLPYSRDGRVFAGTSDNGLYTIMGKRRHWCDLRPGETGVLSERITALYEDGFRNVWVGTDKGVCVYDDFSAWVDGRTVRQLPQSAVYGIAEADPGVLWFATGTGLVRLKNGLTSFYGYKRWVPSPTVTCVAAFRDGTVAAGTPAGLSVLTERTMTLSEKADLLRAQTERFNVRKDGYVLDRALDREGVVREDEGHVRITDNDGLRTGTYVAALCYEYACTKDERVRDAARRSLAAMLKLNRVTGVPGFTARAIRYADEPGYLTGVRLEWRLSEDENGNALEWLGETSSDEMVGHFYCYANYYDLCADEAEKAEIREVIRGILDHILTHDLRLCDVDGKPTTWANWNPELLNHDQKWMNERGTNSLQLLTFLLVGYHMTGDETYLKLFRYYAEDRHYALNLLRYREPDGHVNHIDDNLDFLMIPLLMRYTEDPRLRAVFAVGLAAHWEEERVERNAFFNFVYQAATGERGDVENAVEELIDYPMDQIAWPLYNSGRQGLEWDEYPITLGMDRQLKNPLPAHERRICSSDFNRFTADTGVAVSADAENADPKKPAVYSLPGTDGDTGFSLLTCTNYTHPYWFARYYGLIEG